MTIQVLTRPFDPWQTLARHQQGLEQSGRYGATACFVGTLRDFNQGATVEAMTLEYYPGMTEKYLNVICAEAMQRWSVMDALIVHRTGAVTPSDTIVLTAVWAVHRAEAFAACRYLIEELKTRAPFWKHERLAEGARWVEYSTPG